MQTEWIGFENARSKRDAIHMIISISVEPILHGCIAKMEANQNKRKNKS